jgi:hypothetical protein
MPHGYTHDSLGRLCFWTQGRHVMCMAQEANSTRAPSTRFSLGMLSFLQSCSKINFYAIFSNGTDHAFSVLRSDQHAPRRKSYYGHYVPTNLARHQSHFHDCILDTVRILEAYNGRQAIDCMSLFPHLAVWPPSPPLFIPFNYQTHVNLNWTTNNRST